MELGIIISSIVTFVIGLLLPSPIFKRVLKIGWEAIEFGYKLFLAVKPDADGVIRLTPEEYDELKKEFNDVVEATKAKE